MVIDTRVPVLVVCRGGTGDVAIARTLGRLGVSTHLIAQAGLRTPVSSSRYWKGRASWDFEQPEETSVEFLLEFGARFQSTHGTRPILLTTADWLAIFIERNRDLLQEHFVFPRPPQPTIHALANKWGMHLLATEHGVPTPMAVRPESRADVEAFLETSTFPIVLKPADPYVLRKRAPKITHDRRELLEEVDREAAYGPLDVVLQEYIPGDVDSVWMCNGYFGSNPDHTVIYTGKKLRQTSPTGVACLAVCLPNDTVADQTRRLMQGVGYRGCVGIGWRYDSRDGLYKLLDVNARVSGIFRLFAGTNEMDVVRACYLDLTGQPVPPTVLRPGRKWMLEDDLVASVSAVRSGRLSIAEWARSVRGVRELQWLAPDDPVPFFVWFRGRAASRLRQTAKGIVSRARRPS
jgi:predicted ATP-grasp superfamily ATP-dependent carboligase